MENNTVQTNTQDWVKNPCLYILADKYEILIAYDCKDVENDDKSDLIREAMKLKTTIYQTELKTQHEWIDILEEYNAKPPKITAHEYLKKKFNIVHMLVDFRQEKFLSPVHSQALQKLYLLNEKTINSLKADQKAFLRLMPGKFDF